MHAQDISNGPTSIYTSPNELISTQLLNAEKDLGFPTEDVTFFVENYEKPHLLYTVYGTDLDVKLYKKTVVDFDTKIEKTEVSKHFSHLLILTTYFLLHNEYRGKLFLCSVVKDTLIPLISGMDMNDLEVFWDAIKKRINLSVNHCIDGNSSRRRFLPLREPIKHDIPMILDLFVGACLLELQRIQHHHITEQLTLKHVLREQNDCLLYKLMKKELIGTSVLVYCKRFSKFTRFKEIIEEQLSRVADRIFLIKMLDETCVRTVRQGNKIISLTCDCVKYVVEYLNNDDIRNMIAAFKRNE